EQNADNGQAEADFEERRGMLVTASPLVGGRLALHTRILGSALGRACRRSNSVAKLSRFEAARRSPNSSDLVGSRCVRRRRDSEINQQIKINHQARMRTLPLAASRIPSGIKTHVEIPVQFLGM